MNTLKVCESDIQNKNKMALSPTLRHFQQQKMKGIMKQTLKRRPISIQSLKKSLCINQSNLEEFVKYIKEPPEIFRTSIHQSTQQTNHNLSAEVKGLKNIVKNINTTSPNCKQIFLRRNSYKGKQMKRQLKLQRSQLRFEAQAEDDPNNLNYSFNKGKTNNCLENIKQKMIGLEIRSSKMGNMRHQKHKKNQMRNTFSVNHFSHQSENSTPTSFSFWRRSDKAPSTHRRWKTEADQKSGEKTLGQLTKYNQRKNIRGVNYLAIQLRLNIEDSKRMRQTTGPFY